MNKKVKIVSVLMVFLVVVPVVFAQEQTTPKMTYDEALACVMRQLPADMYSTNDYLPVLQTPEEDIGPTPGGYGKTIQVVVAEGWLDNDEFAPLHVAIDQGYYAAEGLDVEIKPGGPGLDPLPMIGAGGADIAIVAGGAAVPKAVVSTTPIDVVTVGTLLRGMAYDYVTVGPALLDKELTPQDLVGTEDNPVRIATQGGAEFYTWMLVAKYGLDPTGFVFTAPAGFDASELMTNPPVADFYTGWVMNQPRNLEDHGYQWNGLMFRDWVYDEYSDVVTVPTKTLATADGQDMVRRFIRATYRGVQFMLANPDATAEITVRLTGGATTVEQSQWRFAHQEFLVRGRDGLGLMVMAPDEWNRVVSTLVQFGQIEMDCGK